MNISVIIPTRNAAAQLDALLAALRAQSRRPDEILVLDSESSDATGEIAARYGAEFLRIKAAEFNHGGTRNLAASRVKGNVLVYFTHDSLPADGDALKALCACFEDASVGAAYGRQLPRPGAGPLGAHARLFNYPEKSYIRSMSDAGRFGLKTAFMSNSFAAYRREALTAVGGFPADTILSEDMCAAGRMLLAGWRIAYSAEAKVFHSHDYGIAEEFRRYFDIGVFHSSQGWLRKEFGKAEGEGGRFMLSEARYLMANAPLLLPYAGVKNFFKYAGYRLGMLHRFLPLALKRVLSMHRKYWG
jgi:rhamnosyltransferase